jgi:hypothetical protein
MFNAKIDVSDKKPPLVRIPILTVQKCLEKSRSVRIGILTYDFCRLRHD